MDEVVAKWEEMFKMITFRGKEMNIRETYKKLMKDGEREDDHFSV